MSAHQHYQARNPYRLVLGGVRAMWVLALFDMPTETKTHRRAYRRFHDFLISDGYIMLQFSVYGRACANLEAAEKHMRRIEDNLPDEGEVRILSLTALQYARMKRFWGKSGEPPEKQPQQLSFF